MEINVKYEISLSYINVNDAEIIFNLVNENREYLREWLPWLDNTMSIKDTIKFINSCIIGYKNKDNLTFSIKYKNNIIGIISYNKIDYSSKEASIGYWISSKFEGKSIVSNSCRVLINYGFNELNLESIIISCALNNYKSQIIPKKLNFKEKIIVKNKEWLYDKFVDHIIFSINKNEWIND